jgi:ABC-type transporter Mla subunit MlaD
MSITENIIIKLAGQFDSKAFDDLRKELSKNRNELNALARDTVKGSAEWKKYKDEVKQINATLKLSNKEFANQIIAAKKSSKAIDDAHNSTQKLEKGTKKLSDRFVITAGDISSVIGSIVQFGSKSIQMASELAVLRSNFQGTNTELSLFRTATAGTVSDGSLIKLSNYASDLGVNMEDQAKLFSLAEDAADKYGGTVEDNFERVINASDGSARGLRAVGISVKDFEQEVNRLVKTQGIHLDAMSAEEQQNVRLQAIYNLTGTTIETVKNKTADAADKLAILKVKSEEVMVSFGSGFVSAFGNGEKAIDSFSRTADGLGDVMDALGRQAGTVANDIANAFSTAMDWVDSLYAKYATEERKRELERISKMSADEKRVAEGEARAEQRERDKEKEKEKQKTTGSNKKTSGTGTTPKEKNVELTNELIEAQKKYNDLLLIESTFTDDERKQLVYIKYLNQVRDVLSQIQGLQLPATLLNVNGTASDVTGFENVGQIKPYDVAKGKEEGRNIYDDVTNTYGAINNMMSVLNLGTETFVSKLLGGFNSVLIIMESIKAVNSILSFIPGFASGGAFSGGPMIVGERGPELLFANTSGYVMNNQDSQRYLNSSVNNSQPAINLYVGANLSPKYFTAQMEKANSRKNYRKV